MQVFYLFCSQFHSASFSHSSLYFGGREPLKIALPGFHCHLDSGQFQLIGGFSRKLKGVEKGEAQILLLSFVLGGISRSGYISFVILPDSPFLVIPALLDCLGSQGLLSSAFAPLSVQQELPPVVNLCVALFSLL